MSSRPRIYSPNLRSVPLTRARAVYARATTLGKRALYLAIHNMMNKVITKADAKPWAGAVASSQTGTKLDKGRRRTTS